MSENPSDIPTVPLCLYCNEQPGVTAEHVIPRSLFAKPIRSDLKTVPACHECNHGVADEQTYFRDILVMEAGTEHNPVAANIREGALFRSVQRNRSQLAKDAAFKGQIKPLYVGGVYLGDYPTVPVPGGILTRNLERIVRGLMYLWHNEARLPLDTVFDIRKIPFPYIELRWREFTEGGAGGPGGYENVFAAKFFWDLGGDPVRSLWLLRFYDGVMYLVETYPYGERLYGEEDVAPA